MEKHRPEDELFKKILENHPKFELRPDDLDDMNKRLDGLQTPKQKNKGAGWWWLLLPFLVSTCYLFYQNHQLLQQVERLDGQLSTLETLQRDTTQHHHTLHYYDTVYQTTYLEEIVRKTKYLDDDDELLKANASVLNYPNNNFRTFAFNSSSLFASKQSGVTIPIARTSPRLHQTYLNHLDRLPVKTSDSSADPIMATAEYLEQRALAKRKMISLPSLSYLFNTAAFDFSISDTIQELLPMVQRKSNPFRHLAPKGIRIGLTASPFGLLNPGSGSSKSALAYGIGGEIEFNKRLRFLIGLRNVAIKFEEKDPARIAVYPSTTPENPNDQIRELHVGLNQLQVPIGFKYLLSEDRKFTPFFTVGFVASRATRQKFEYSFINTALQEYSLDQSLNEGAFSIKNVQGAFGLEYGLNQKIFASSQLFYFHDFELNVGEYFLMRHLGLSLSLKYKL